MKCVVKVLNFQNLLLRLRRMMMLPIKRMIRVNKATMAAAIATTTMMMEMKQDLIVRVLP
jgi:hypothetical protein